MNIRKFLIFAIFFAVVLTVVVFLPKPQPKTGQVNDEPVNLSQTNGNSESSVSLETNPPQTVPLPSQEDIIRTFFELINEKRIPEAIGMMSDQMVPDDSAKQAWGVQFNAIKSVTTKEITKIAQDEFKVSVNVSMSPESAKAVIPYYGWDSNPSTRFITLVKVGKLWKIGSIATGP